MNAPIKKSYPPTWKGICRVLLGKGLCFLLGSSSHVRIWSSDPWIPSIPNFISIPSSAASLEV
jgi:hypothetical protein